MKYLKYFKTDAAYTVYKNSDNFVLPNVSYIVGNKKTIYTGVKSETPIVLKATYNAVDDGEYGMYCYSNKSNIKSIKIDGVGVKFSDEVVHNNTYELNDSNIIVNWDEWAVDFSDEIMFNGRVNSLTLKPKDNSIVLSQEAFDSGEISLGYVYIDEWDNKYIDVYNILAGDGGEWNFDASNNSISSSDDAINGDWWSYHSCALFLARYTNDMNFPEIIDTVSVVNYTTGGAPFNYSFENEGIHEVEIVLKDNLIGYDTFCNCTSLTSVTIPDSVTSTGINTFGNCKSLASVTIPDSVTEIGKGAFGCCESLTSITIPDSVTSIGKDAFNSCTSLASVTIPDSVTEIGDSAFHRCSSLTSVTIPNGVTSIGSSTFSSSGLTSVTIPNSVTSISDYAFSDCTSLTSVTIPDSVTSIGYRAFYKCSNITSVIIGNSVTSIGSAAFGLCTALTSVYCKAVTPPTLTSDIIPSNVTTIYVPMESVNAYKTASYWSKYNSSIVGYNF